MDMQDFNTYPNGTIIAGNFEIVSFLAAGGMAQVYVAKQLNLGREVALKVLSPMFSMNQNVVMRFFREARVIAQFQHPNIVNIIDMGETPDHRLFFAMELLQGEELSERIKRGPMTPAEILPIVRQVARSLSVAHKHGIIHRDLKPDNIFLTTIDVVKVLDFGIAKLKDDDQDSAESERKLTKAGTAPGTAEYMSPEQARGKELDARSDIYSLGIVMYEMLCGHPPFEENTYLGTILLQVQAPPPPLPDSVPQPLANYIIHRLLSKTPKDRPENAENLIKELDDLSKRYNLEGNSVSEQELEQLSQAKAEIEALRRKLEESNQEKAALNVDYAKLTQAKVEAEALRSKLAQTQMELMKSSDNTPVLDTNFSISTGPSHTRAPLPSQEIRITNMQPPPMVNDNVRPPQARLIPIQNGAFQPQQTMQMMPAKAQLYPPQNMANAQSAMNIGRPGVPPQMMQTQQGMSQMMQTQQGIPQMMQRLPSRPGMPAVPQGMLKQPMGMPGMPSRNGLEPVSNARYGALEEPIIPPTPRHGSRISAAPASNTPAAYTDTSKLPFREMPDEIDYDNHEVEEIHSAQGRPKDLLTGRQTKPKNSVSAHDRESAFMSFSQPLSSKLGPDKLSEALELAKNVWNAVIDGPDAERVLLLSAGKHTNLGKIIQLMITRKNKFFSNEMWSIEKVQIKQLFDGRVDIHIQTSE